MTTEIKTQEFPNVKVVMVEYDMATGQAIRTLESLNFDKTTVNSFCTPVVIKMNVVGVKKISNIRLGIINSSQTFSTNLERNSDQSISDGIFGIEHNKNIIIKQTLNSFFAGINDDGKPNNENNVLINNLTNNSSEYIYLNTKTRNHIERGFISYKWFFDFVI